ncbi:MAG: hypothetical protein R3Y36_04040 [Spirochaetales bacterium]
MKGIAKKRFCLLYVFIFLSIFCLPSYSVGKNDALDYVGHWLANEQQFAKTLQQLPSTFKYILPNGEIHPDYEGEHDALVALFSPRIDELSNIVVADRSFTVAEINKEQTPTMHFKNEGQWLVSNEVRGESKYRGEDFYALGFKAQHVMYYRYSGKSPFFEPTDYYNRASYHSASGEIENVLSRFMFYRWTASSMGVPLDNYMLAVDTYTGLVFSFVKISTWNSFFGIEVPVSYGPVDIYEGQDGHFHWFFEYDPIGYLDADGTVILHDWYIENTKQKVSEQLFHQLPLGKSPYYEHDTELLASDKTFYSE